MRPDTSARYRAATEARHGQTFTDEQWERMVERYEQKRRARYAVAKNLELGNIEAYVCTFCGSNDSEAHHPDYSWPLAVVWLCRKHHKREHVALSKMSMFAKAMRNSDMLSHAKRHGESSLWTIEEALMGFQFPDDEPFDWGSVDDFQDTLVEYDQEEVARSNADSEDCLPRFVHPLDVFSTEENMPMHADTGEPVKAMAGGHVCPHCNGTGRIE